MWNSVKKCKIFLENCDKLQKCRESARKCEKDIKHVKNFEKYKKNYKNEKKQCETITKDIRKCDNARKRRNT